MGIGEAAKKPWLVFLILLATDKKGNCGKERERDRIRGGERKSELKGLRKVKGEQEEMKERKRRGGSSGTGKGKGKEGGKK